MPELIAIPIGMLLTAGLGEVAATGAILGTGLTLTGIVSSVVAVGAAYGAESLLASHSRHAQPTIQMPPGPVSFEAEAVATQPRFYSYGRVRIGGVFCFRESDGVTLGYGLVINCRPIDAWEVFYIDDEIVTLVSGPCTAQTLAGPTYGVTTVDFGPTVYWPDSGLKWTSFVSYVWSSNQAIPYVTGYGPCGFVEPVVATDAGKASIILQNYFPNLWTSAHKNRGLTCIYSTWKNYAITDRMGHYPRLFPVHSTILRGARVYDPRDAAQSFLDPTSGSYSVYNPTWKYSSNPALLIADFLTFPDGFGLTSDRINWSSFAKAANDCDRVVASFGGGVEPFAQAHLTWSADQERRDVLNMLVAACDGQIYEDPNGQINLWIGQWEDPIYTFTGADISSIVAEQLNGVYADSNYVTPSYVEPRTNYTKNTALYVTDDASIAAVGERKTSIDFPAVESFSQAYRLAYRGLRRRNTPMRLQINGGPRLRLADGQRVVGINLPEIGLSGVFRVMEMVEEQSLVSYNLTLQQVTADMFLDVVPPFDPVNQTIPGVAIVASFVPVQPYAPSGAATVTGTTAYIQASITPPPSMTPAPGVPAQEYQDTSSVAHFQARAVDPSTHAPLGGGAFTGWTNFVSQYVAQSPTITGSAGVAQCFEVQSWLVTPTGTPGPISPSSFVTVSF